MSRVISGMRTADKIESNIMQPASDLAGKMDLKLDGQVAAGMGVEASLSLIDGAGDVSIVMAGQGAAVSLTLQPGEGASMALPGNGGDAPTSFVVEAGAGRIAFAAAEVEANPGGTVEVTPKIGVGAGQYMKTTPAMKVLDWGGASKDKNN